MSGTASNRPAAHVRLSSRFRRGLAISPRMIDAIPNRTAMNVAGLVSPTTLLTIAKLVPHTTHMPTRLRSARSDLDDVESPLRNFVPYSHSIVDGGLEVMSYTTLLIPGTSETILLEIASSASWGRRAHSAVIASSLVTARTAIT